MFNKEKVYRSKPIREMSLEQTMYQTVKTANQGNLDFMAIGYKGQTVQYGELLERVDRLAAAFVMQGVAAGEVVSVCMLNTPEVAEILLALNKIGAVSKWIDLRSTDKQLIKYINEQNSEIFIGLDIFSPRMEYILRETNIKKAILVSLDEKKLIDEASNDKIISYNDFTKLADNYEAVQAVAFDKDRPTLIIQSSGTTGLAKSIVHTDYTVSSHIKCFNFLTILFMQVMFYWLSLCHGYLMG